MECKLGTHVYLIVSRHFFYNLPLHLLISTHGGETWYVCVTHASTPLIDGLGHATCSSQVPVCCSRTRTFQQNPPHYQIMGFFYLLVLLFTCKQCLKTNLYALEWPIMDSNQHAEFHACILPSIWDTNLCCPSIYTSYLSVHIAWISSLQVLLAYIASNEDQDLALRYGIVSGPSVSGPSTEDLTEWLPVMRFVRGVMSSKLTYAKPSLYVCEHACRNVVYYKPAKKRFHLCSFKIWSG